MRNLVVCILNIVTLLIYQDYCSAAKILAIFPTPSYSHQQPLLALSYALAKKGHQLTTITTNPSKEPINNVREIDLSKLYKEWEEIQKLQGSISLQKRNNDPIELANGFRTFMEYLMASFSKQPQLLQFIREVNGTKYDLILYEALVYSGFLGLAEIVGNPPIVGVVTFHTFVSTDEPMGNLVTPSYVPQIFTRYTDKMTIYERFMNTYTLIYYKYMHEFYFKKIQEEFLKLVFGDLKHTAEELENNKSLLIISADLSTGYPRPVQPNTVYVGSMHLTTPKPLTQDLQKWMDESEDGVIYFSLGSNMKGTSLPEHVRSAFIKAFENFPRLRVLWKWENDTKIPDQPDNVLTKKWLPQQSILAHPKVKVFISQVGAQSLQESVSNGIPILSIPMFGDQDFNARKVEDAGAGITLEFNEISFETVYEKLKLLLTNPSYKKNMLRLSAIAKDKPMSAIDTAVWWVEYVLRHDGAPHLKPAVLDLSWYQYYMLDIFAIILTILFIILYVTYFVIKSLFFESSCKKYNKLKKTN